MTTGWKLDLGARLALIEEFPPRYGKVVADHITLAAGNSASDSAPGPVGEAMIIGHADDGEGVEAYVVAIDGSTDRPDGGTWHITWSLGPGRSARESTDVIDVQGWRDVLPRPLLVHPASW